jgi:NADPH:quinone reductase
VVIRVEAAGVNRPDVLQRKGMYAPPAGASDLPGLEVAGTIVGGDPGASGFAMGDAVCALVPGGGYAEVCVGTRRTVPADSARADFAQAAALPETFFTVWSNVFDRARLAPGESLLVQGGTSGIGVAAIQLAAALGNPFTRPPAATRSAARCWRSARGGRSTIAAKILAR